MANVPMANVLNVSKDKKSVEVIIYDEIGKSWFGDGYGAKDFVSDLEGHKDLEGINVRINSPGGSVSDGIAIYNGLRSHDARVVVNIDGVAASSASLIAMAGDEINMAENGLLMIHDPTMMQAGDANDMRKAAEILDKHRDAIALSYQKQTGLNADVVEAMMTEETWMNAEEAKEQGFIHNITDELEVAASIGSLQPPGKYKPLLDRSGHIRGTAPVRKPIAATKSEDHMSDKTTEPKAATVKEIVAAFPKADASWVLEQATREVQMEEVKDAWSDHLEAKLEKAEADAKAKAKADADAKAKDDAEAKKKVEAAGNAAVSDSTGETGADDAVQAYQTEVLKRAESLRDVFPSAGPTELRTKAAKALERENPALRQACLSQAGLVE